MHNNFYFLRQLSERLDSALKGYTLVSCFSQEKDEMVLEFNNSNRSFFIKAALGQDFQCLYFPEVFRRARKNSIDLFSPILMHIVKGVRVFQNERSLCIELNDEFMLVFKMHGKQANVICLANKKVIGIFRNNFPSDLELQLDTLDRSIDWSFDNFHKHSGQPDKIYFTFGTPVWQYLAQEGFDNQTPEEQWKSIIEVKKLLEHPAYNLVHAKDGLRLTLLPSENVLAEYQDPLKAINDFFVSRNQMAALYKAKSTLQSELLGRKKQAMAFLDKNREKLEELTNDHHYSRWADLIMANLHSLRQGLEYFEAAPFEEPDAIIRIPLRRELSPQKNAEVYYRKAKNKQIELQKLTDSIAAKEKELASLEAWFLQSETANKEELDSLSSNLHQKATAKQQKIVLPYHEFTFKGFKIWVGKSAETNDILTLKLSHKDDLWLHARDVAGSHVLLRHQSGKVFPKDVIEHAAQLAAYYSKRKNESLCPVSYTTKKYVRKRKGDPPGMVVVEREDVILVEPRR